MISKNSISKLYSILPPNERIIRILKYIPTEEYEFSNEIYLIKTLTGQYVLKLLDERHLENNKEKEINNIISQNTSCKVPKIFASDAGWILMEYIDGIELSKLIERDAIDMYELEVIAKKLGEYMGEIFVKCRSLDIKTPSLENYNNEVICSSNFLSLLPFNIEIMMVKQNNEWCISGMLDLELMKYGDVNEYIHYIMSSKVVMIPGIKKRWADVDNRINRKYVETLLNYIKSSS